MKIKPKDVLINLPVVLLFKDESEAASLASGFNTFIHGKVHMKYDVLGLLNEQTVVIFYLQRNDEFHSLRDQFINLIDREEVAPPLPINKEFSGEF